MILAYKYISKAIVSQKEFQELKQKKLTFLYESRRLSSDKSWNIFRNRI